LSNIRLGFEVGSGKEININPSHLIVTGLSQFTGKTTTLEALISRSKKRAIVFRTKVGEKSFIEGTIIPEIDYDTIFAKVLQKMPVAGNVQNIDEDVLMQKILSRLPKTVGNVTYEVAPLEKIKKDFIQTAKNKIIDDISKLSDESKQMLKYLESRNVEVTVNELCMKCFLMKQSGGGYGQAVNTYGKDLIEYFFADKKQNGRYRGTLRNRINELLQIHEASNEDIENLYNHIIIEMLSIGVKN